MEKLFTPDSTRYSQPSGAYPESDYVTADHLGGTPDNLVEELSALIGRENVLSRLSDLVRYASDASPYRMIPEVIVRPRHARDLSLLMNYANEHGRHLVFRAGGSSLNGQSISDDILVDAKWHFTGMKVLDGGARIWSRPGVVLGDAQAILARSGYMIGPDPGSTSVCCIGGVIADNSGGMRCSLERDCYHTVESLTFVLPSGTIVDTTDLEADQKLAAAEPELVAGLLAIRDEIRSDTALVEFLRKKFSIRNTNGLRLDAFLDEDTPVRILMKLMVGSEGIFGAITESIIRTIPLPKVKACAWVMLPDLKAAANYVQPLMATGAEACELLVADVMQTAVGNFPAAKPEWKDMDSNAAALLLEVGGQDEEDLSAAIARAEKVLDGVTLLEPLTFMTDPKEMRGAWQIRNGVYGLCGAHRSQGSTLITEDVCFPPAEIGQGSADLLDLINEYGYPPLLMGHAPFGNLHFFMTPNFEVPEEKDKYAAFLNDLTELVIDKYQGSLKAEHGTGLNMAPFLEREWGTKAWEMMWRVKKLIDPNGILAPNVKLTRSKDIHLKNFQSFPVIEDEIAHCVECGMCEPVCPSRHVTVTPRQRIVLRREMARQPAGSEVLKKLQEEYQYDAVEMCAADGTCSIACPVSIDTGKVMKMMRAQSNGSRAEKVALKTAENWAIIEKAARGIMLAANRVQKVAGYGLLKAAADSGRLVITTDLLPTVPGNLPKAAPKTLPQTQREGATAVYFPACINRIFGKPHDAPIDQVEIPEAVVLLGKRSGRPVWIPDDVTGDCCGTPWSSKGYTEGFTHQAQRIARDFWRWSDSGRLPIIVDAASCTHGILEKVPHELHGIDLEQFQKITILDVVQWLRDEVMPGLTITNNLGKVVVHPTCSTMHMGIDQALVDLCRPVAEKVDVPFGARCCGTAGDRGLLHPELTESATREEREGITDTYDYFVSDNRTCEMGLEMIAGKPYQSIACLLERASRPVVTP